MGNLPVKPEHVQLLNELRPHLGEKGQALMDKVLNVLPLLTNNSAQGGLDSLLKLMTFTKTKSNGDSKQATGQLIQNFFANSLKGKSSGLGPAFLVFLLLILLVQDFQ